MCCYSLQCKGEGYFTVSVLSIEQDVKSTTYRLKMDET